MWRFLGEDMVPSGNCYVTMEGSTMLFQWVNPLFRLGRFQYIFLCLSGRVAFQGLDGFKHTVLPRKHVEHQRKSAVRRQDLRGPWRDWEALLQSYGNFRE